MFEHVCTHTFANVGKNMGEKNVNKNFEQSGRGGGVDEKREIN